MDQLDECIKDCETAIEKGRELCSDYKNIARAYGRLGNAHFKLDHLDEAINCYNKSLTECRTPEVLTKLREV